jgi:molybdenum cofactor synthesis domain-containing protein
MMRVGILTVSDKASRGQREDLSGKVIREIVGQLPAQVVKYTVVPDDRARIEKELVRISEQVDLVLTTGGTGLSPKDVTPEATACVIEKIVPGISEAMRMEGLKRTHYALLSRAIAGVRKTSLIINLPGSPKAVRENLEAILPAIPHAIETLKGEGGECAGK